MKKKQRTDQFKSDEELYFSWWLDELKEKGIVFRWYYENKEFILADKAFFDSKTLLQEHGYTPDFTICWTPDYRPARIPIKLSDRLALVSLVDVKGGYSNNFNDMRFPLNQKWMYQKFGLYVNKIIPVSGFRINSKKEKVLKKCLFSETFTPKKYMLTPTGKERTIHWKVRTIDQFLEEIR
ncbi:MAG TPA: hypothetical protein PLZ43_08025 [bacterium]|nr:hypothetical protein [bacterium]